MSRRSVVAFYILCGVGVLLFLFGLLRASVGLVGGSYGSEELLGVGSGEGVGYLGEDSVESRLGILYSEKNLIERQRAYLGKDYDRWIPVINHAMASYADEVSVLTSAGGTEGIETSYYGDLSVGDLYCIVNEKLEESLTLVGMCDSTTLMFSYKRMENEKPRLVVLDTSEILSIIKRSTPYSFGDSIPIPLKKGSFSVESNDDYTIVYVKG